MTDAARLAHARLLERAASSSAALERLAAIACRLLRTDGALVTLTDDVQVAIRGASTAPAVAALAARTAAEGEVLAEEAGDDETPSFLGVPLLGRGGEVLGALGVHEPRPRTWTADDREVLLELAVSVVAELELGTIAGELDASAARLELGLTAAQVGSFDWDLRTELLWWDERLMTLFGYEPADFTPHIDAFFERVHPDDRERVQRAIDVALDACGEYAAEYRVVLPGGRARWVAARGRVLCGPDGVPVRLLGAAYDTTETHDARHTLARQLETMASAFFSLDRAWRFTYVNAEGERVLGRLRSELVGRVIWEEFPAAVGSAFEEQYRRAMASDAPVMFDAYYPPPLDAWYEVRAWPAPEGLAVYFLDISARRRAEEQREEANARLRLLLEAGDRLAGSLEARTVVGTLLDIAVPALGHLAVVVVTPEVESALHGRTPSGEDQRLVHVLGVAHAEADLLDPLEQLMRNLPLTLDDAIGAGRVIRTGEAEWLPAVTDEVLGSLPLDHDRLQAVRKLDLSSALTVPLVSRGRPLGALTVTNPAVGELDRQLVEEVAARAAAALDNAVLYSQSRRVGLTLQRSLLPGSLPQPEGVELAVRYLPGVEGIEVGGDFYIAHELGDGRLLLAMGDVMGRGIHAAAEMGQLRSVALTLAYGGDSPELVLDRLSDVVEELLDLQLATLLLVVYDPATRRLDVASAGHPPPLLAALGEEPYYLPLEPGPPLGTGAATHRLFSIEVPSGSSLVLYTDGLVERRDQSIGEGMEALRQALVDVKLPPDAVCDHALHKTGRDRGSDDDVAILVLAHP